MAYLLTGFDRNGELVQIAIQIPNGPSEYTPPIDCCTNARSTNFWRDKLNEFNIDRISSVKRIAGLTQLT